MSATSAERVRRQFEKRLARERKLAERRAAKADK
jgi:hypothetical protein